MAQNDFYTVNVPLAQIQLDTENLRYEPGSLQSQKDCIERIVNDNRAKILNLARNIAEKPFYPDPIVLSKKSDGKWVVREGNRRITALKLLNNPNICPDNKKKEALKKIKGSLTHQLPTSIDAVTHDNEEVVWDYIKTRHTGADEGRGLISWGAYEQDNLNLMLGKPERQPLSRLLLNLYKALGHKVKTGFPVTTLERALVDSDFIKRMGLQKVEGNLSFIFEPNEVVPIISVLIRAIDDKEIKVKDVYYKDDREVLADRLFTDYGLKKPKKKLSASKLISSYIEELNKDDAGGKSGQDSSKGKGKPPKKKKSTARKCLVEGSKIKISEEHHKAGDILHEISILDVQRTPLAVAMLLRSLIELGVEKYASEYALKFTLKTTLANKVRSVALKMRQLGQISDKYCQAIEKSLDSYKEISISDFNAYVHEPSVIPTSAELNTHWTRLDEFLCKCWE